MVKQTEVKNTIRIPSDLHAALVVSAESESRSLNGQIVYLLRKSLPKPTK